MIDWRRSENVVRKIVEREDRPQPTVEVYDPRYLEYLNGQREDVPEPEDKRGVLIIPML
jgi:hypothetical protein